MATTKGQIGTGAGDPHHYQFYIDLKSNVKCSKVTVEFDDPIGGVGPSWKKKPYAEVAGGAGL